MSAEGKDKFLTLSIEELREDILRYKRENQQGIDAEPPVGEEQDSPVKLTPEQIERNKIILDRIRDEDKVFTDDTSTLQRRYRRTRDRTGRFKRPAVDRENPE
jgi:DNA-directed RNA polymerase subunit K/omega